MSADGQIGVNFPTSAEAKAFSRWQDEEFRGVERDFAALWREDLRQLDLHGLASQVTEIVSGRRCRSLAEAKDLAVSVVTNNTDPYGQIRRFIEHLCIDREYHREIVGRLTTLNFPELSRYAPYSAHVLTVELFFRIALASGLISSDRPSNWVDMAYLFYLPFCVLFVSSDKLHRKCAPLLVRSKQEFVWGPDLKEGLRELNVHYSAYPEAVRNEGLLRFASHPPAEGDYLVTQLWDRHAPRWRAPLSLEGGDETEGLNKLGERIRRFKEATPVHDSALSGTGPEFRVPGATCQGGQGLLATDSEGCRRSLTGCAIVCRVGGAAGVPGSIPTEDYDLVAAHGAANGTLANLRRANEQSAGTKSLCGNLPQDTEVAAVHAVRAADHGVLFDGLLHGAGAVIRLDESPPTKGQRRLAT